MKALLSWLIMLTMFVPSSWAVTNDQEFINQFSAAHQKKDFERFSKLVCWRGVDSQMKEMLEKGFQQSCAQEIDSIEITDPDKNEIQENNINGKIYRLNLRVVKKFTIKFKPPSNSLLQLKKRAYRLGLINGKYAITVPVQVHNKQE